MKSDIGLEVLLSLDGTEYTEENGYWYKIEVSKVEPTKERPHGIRYNLTLHDNYNQRILGFDNAHAVKAKKHGYYTGTIVSYDHVHRSIKDKGVPYEFENAQQLLTDLYLFTTFIESWGKVRFECRLNEKSAEKAQHR